MNPSCAANHLCRLQDSASHLPFNCAVCHSGVHAQCCTNVSTNNNNNDVSDVNVNQGINLVGMVVCLLCAANANANANADNVRLDEYMSDEDNINGRDNHPSSQRSVPYGDDGNNINSEVADNNTTTTDDNNPATVPGDNTMPVDEEAGNNVQEEKTP